MLKIHRPDRLVALVLSNERDPQIVPLVEFLRTTQQNLREHFTQVELGTEWLGFYDWLRDTQGEVVGLRLCPYEGQELFIKDFSKLKGLQTEAFHDSRLKLLLAFFGENQAFDESKSDDQAFGGNHVFKGSGGTIVITLYSPPTGDKPA